MATLRTRATSPVLVNWTKNQEISDSAFTTVWLLPAISAPLEFYRTIFQLDSTNVLMRVRINNEGIDNTHVDVDLGELSGVYKLHKATGLSFSVIQYESPSLWSYEPYNGLLVPSGAQLIVEMKAVSGIKMLVCGMSEWGQQ